VNARQKAVAWRKLARRWEREAVERHSGYALNMGCHDGCYAWGLCGATPPTLLTDLDAVMDRDEDEPFRSAYWWDLDAFGRDCRVIACCLMAAITEAGDLP